MGLHFRAHEIGLFGALAIAAALGGCANLDENKDVWFSKPFQVVSRNAGYTFSELQESKSRQKPITPNDLVAANGSCPAPPVQQAAAPPPGDQTGSTPPAASDAGTLLGGGIALGMTECDVVFRAGAPSAVQIGKSPNGDRTAVLTFSSGPRPGIYHFESGALTEVERGQSAPAPAQAAKKKPAPPAKNSKETSGKPASSQQAAKE